MRTCSAQVSLLFFCTERSRMREQSFPGRFSKSGLGRLCICYYTFWSGVADLSAMARAPEGGGRINRNTTTKGVIKCLLQWFGVISWQRSRKRARFPVHRPYTGPFTSVFLERFSMAASSSSFLRAFWLVLPIVSVFDRALDRVGE